MRDMSWLISTERIYSNSCELSQYYLDLGAEPRFSLFQWQRTSVGFYSGYVQLYGTHIGMYPVSDLTLQVRC